MSYNTEANLAAIENDCITLQNKIKEYKNYRTIAISNPALLLYVYRGFVQHKVGWERDVFNFVNEVIFTTTANGVKAPGELVERPWASLPDRTRWWLVAATYAAGGYQLSPVVAAKIIGQFMDGTGEANFVAIACRIYNHMSKHQYVGSNLHRLVAEQLLLRGGNRLDVVLATTPYIQRGTIRCTIDEILSDSFWHELMIEYQRALRNVNMLNKIPGIMYLVAQEYLENELPWLAQDIDLHLDKLADSVG